MPRRYLPPEKGAKGRGRWGPQRSSGPAIPGTGSPMESRKVWSKSPRIGRGRIPSIACWSRPMSGYVFLSRKLVFE